MTQHKYCIGITSIGSGVGQSAAIGCRLAGLPLRIIGLGSNPFAYGSHDCDLSLPTPMVNDPDYFPSLLTICREQGIEMLIPGLDMELLPMAKHREEFAGIGVHVLTAGEGFLSICRDKLRMSRELCGLSNAFIPGWTKEEALEGVRAGRIDFPLVSKPADGFASRYVCILLEREDFNRINADALIQPLIFPEKSDPSYESFKRAVSSRQFMQSSEISLQLVVSESGEVLGRMASYHELNLGMPVEVVPISRNDIWEPIDTLMAEFRSLGIYGPVNIQGRITDDGPRFFEINARFTGITGLRAMMGFNEVEALIRDAMGCDRETVIACLNLNNRKIGIRQMANRAMDVDRLPQIAGRARRVPGYAGRDERLSVLVTGATGYLGRALVKRLLVDDRVREVRAAIRDSLKAADMLTYPGSERLNLVTLDTAGAGHWNPGTVDIVYHLAAARSHSTPAEIADSIDYTRRLVEIAARSQLPGFIFASSQSVYGRVRPAGVKWGESSPLNPDSFYAMSKIAGEQLVASLDTWDRHLAHTSIRFARLWGHSDGYRAGEMPHVFIEQAAVGMPIRIQGGKQVLDLIHIDDAVNALLGFLSLPYREWQTAYNCGSGEGFSVARLAQSAVEAAERKIGAKSHLTFEESSAQHNMCMDISRLSNQLGWTPQVSLENGMMAMMRAGQRVAS